MSNPPSAPPAPRGSVRPVSFAPVPPAAGHRIVLYGPGGIGKTTLACLAPGPVAFIDLDESLPRLRSQLAECPTPLAIRTVAAASWAVIREALAAPGWDEVRTLVIDSATRAEELCAAWVIRNIPHEQKGVVVQRIEDYGYGKGYQHIYDTFLCLLADLDQHARAGRNVILICHDCTSAVPNPKGQDWIRYEPRLQSSSTGKSSVRLRVREWADHVLFIGYDVEVKGGRGSGSGTRTVYPAEMPHCMAKSRTLADPKPLNRFDPTLWNTLFGGNAQ